MLQIDLWKRVVIWGLVALGLLLAMPNAFYTRVETHNDATMALEMGGQFIPLILIFAIMWFLLIRPQQKKMKEHQAMVAALRKGDQIVTQGGMIGKVTRVKEGEEIEVEIAEGVKVRIVRNTVAQVLSKTEPAA